MNRFRGGGPMVTTDGAVFSQKQHAVELPALTHRQKRAVPENLGHFSLLFFVVAKWAKSSTKRIAVSGEAFQNNSCDIVVAAEKGPGALCGDLCKLADDFKTLRGRFSTAGKGISHGGERLQEGRSQGDTKQNRFVFGA